MCCITPVERFWSSHLDSAFSVAEEPPCCFAAISTPRSEWQKWSVTDLTPADVRQAARDARFSAWWEQCKAMSLIVGSFFTGVASVLSMLFVANLVVDFTLVLFASLFSLPIVGPLSAFVVVGFEVINIALIWLVLIGQLFTKILIPTVASCLNYQLHLEDQAFQLEGRTS